ncbi:hypothetical protein C5167_042219 [Papaver somniferum]|uniref:RNA helicase n=1 Tax=Papaver somniferum TaxID=3469 RepID=A0A4Y7L267_PAPSO|nr:hypothetical protein C5167_042219 [Papaver somniferum]
MYLQLFMIHVKGKQQCRNICKKLSFIRVSHDEIVGPFQFYGFPSCPTLRVAVEATILRDMAVLMKALTKLLDGSSDLLGEILNGKPGQDHAASEELDKDNADKCRNLNKQLALYGGRESLKSSVYLGSGPTGRIRGLGYSNMQRAWNEETHTSSTSLYSSNSCWSRCFRFSPDRELAYQLAEQFRALGASLHLRCAVVVGGMDMITQAQALMQRPHVVIATLGRIKDLLEQNPDIPSVFSKTKFLVLDEADRVLDVGFKEELCAIFQYLPKDRQTLLFSETMTQNLQTLLEVSANKAYFYEQYEGFKTVESLKQQYVFVPKNVKENLLHVLSKMEEMGVRSAIIFVSTCRSCHLLSLLLEELEQPTVGLHSHKSQALRLSALHRFKSGQTPILLATDVASRGLDIPTVDLVINYDIPRYAQDYVHRVRRTARAGRGGLALAHESLEKSIVPFFSLLLPEPPNFMYAFLFKRRAQVLKKEMQQGSSWFTVQHMCRLMKFRVCAGAFRKKTGVSSALLVLCHWEELSEDPFFVPNTEEIEESDDGSNILPNTARKLIDAVRRRKGLPVEEKVDQRGTKRRILSRKVMVVLLMHLDHLQNCTHYRGD